MPERTSTKKKHGDKHKQRVFSAGWFFGRLACWLAVSRYPTRIWFRFYCPRIAEAIFRLLRPLRRRPSWISPVRSRTMAFVNWDKNVCKNPSSRRVSVFYCFIISRNIAARNGHWYKSEARESFFLLRLPILRWKKYWQHNNDNADKLFENRVELCI